MARKIFTVNFPLPIDAIEEIDFFGSDSLLDADIVVVNPEGLFRQWHGIMGIRPTGEKHIPRGRDANTIKSVFEIRRGEFDQILQKGGAVFCFLGPLESFSLTLYNGINRQPIDNYLWLSSTPTMFRSHLVSRGGNEVKPTKAIGPFNLLLKAFPQQLSYKAYLKIDSSDQRVMATNKSDQAVLLLERFDKSFIAFIPYLAATNEGWENKLIPVLTQITDEYLGYPSLSPPPDWADAIELPGEDEKKKTIEKTEKQLDKLEDTKATQRADLQFHLRYKSLLYSKNRELEDAVIQSFQLLGFKADRFQSETGDDHDLHFEIDGKDGLGEVGGKDNGKIDKDKAQDLSTNEDEYFTSKGKYPDATLLIGNAFAKKALEERDDPFTEHVWKMAERRKWGLLTTPSLFRAVVKVLENPNDEELKKKIRERIMTTKGDEIKFDDISPE